MTVAFRAPDVIAGADLALVIDGYRQAMPNHQSPAYYLVKAAMANTAGTNAWETPIVGLIGGVKAKRLGQDPNAL